MLRWLAGMLPARSPAQCDTVFEEVGFALQNLGVVRNEMVERIEWALEALRDQPPARALTLCAFGGPAAALSDCCRARLAPAGAGPR